MLGFPGIRSSVGKRGRGETGFRELGVAIGGAALLREDWSTMTRVGEAAQLIESHGSDCVKNEFERVHIGLSVSPQDDDLPFQQDSTGGLTLRQSPGILGQTLNSRGTRISRLSGSDRHAYRIRECDSCASMFTIYINSAQSNRTDDQPDIQWHKPGKLKVLGSFSKQRRLWCRICQCLLKI